MCSEGEIMTIKKLGLAITSSLSVLAVAGSVQAAELALSDTPLFITSATKPNVLMILDTSGSMHYNVSGGFVRGDSSASRSEIARSAAKMVIDRFGGQFNLGLMSYDQNRPRLYSKRDIYGRWLNYWGGPHGNGGGRLDAPIKEVDSSHQATLMSLLGTEQYSSATDVPLRNSGGTPIEGSLYSARDYFKGNLSSSNIASGLGSLPSLPNSCGHNYTVLLTDGEPTTSASGGGYSGSQDAIQLCANAASALRNAIVYTDPDTGDKRYVDTYVVGFSQGIGAGTLDRIAAAGGTTESYDAADEAALETSLKSIFSSIAAKTASRSAAAANSVMLTTNSLIYQAGFGSGSWAGSLTARPVNAPNTLGTVNWDAADQYPNDWTSGRKVLTWDGSSGVAFTAGNMSNSMRTWLNDNPSTEAVDNDGLYSKRIDYLRGERADNISGASFRKRDKALGDIVYSSPVYVGAPSFSYPDSLESASYSSFKNTNKSRRPMVYVGANDGMLHGFDASADAEVSGEKKGGKEVFSYVPNAVYQHLSKLTDPGYTYHPTVDGKITVGDAFWDGSWKTVLVGALRGGGQGFYALDVTDPDSVTEANAASKVLWEYTDENNKHMGYSYGAAAIVKMANGHWAAVFGNGYNNTEADGIASNHGKGVLYIVKLKDGSLIKKIVVPSGTTSSPNGLATPAPVDTDGDSIVDVIYAGDLNGNLWEFDVSNSKKSKWGIANSSTPLFVATDSSGNRQAITTRPEVVNNPITDHTLVLFGTGKYLEMDDTDPAKVAQQTFYGVQDSGTVTASLTRSSLVAQEVKATKVHTSAGETMTYRLVSDNPVDWAGGAIGWKLDFPVQGEMVIENPIARNEQAIFSTIVPASNVCTVGGTSWFMEIDYLSGGRSTDGVIDVDGDHVIDDNDHLTFSTDTGSETAAVSGFQSRQGFLTSPLILSPESIDPDNPVEYKFITGSLGGVERVVEKATTQSSGRLSWRQIH